MEVGWCIPGEIMGRGEGGGDSSGCFLLLGGEGGLLRNLAVPKPAPGCCTKGPIHPSQLLPLWKTGSPAAETPRSFCCASYPLNPCEPQLGFRHGGLPQVWRGVWAHQISLLLMYPPFLSGSPYGFSLCQLRSSVRFHLHPVCVAVCIQGTEELHQLSCLVVKGELINPW